MQRVFHFLFVLYLFYFILFTNIIFFVHVFNSLLYLSFPLVSIPINSCKGVCVLYQWYNYRVHEHNRLNLSLSKVPKIKIQDKSQILLCKILKYKQYHVKVLLMRFHLNGHTAGFHPETQKLETPFF